MTYQETLEMVRKQNPNMPYKEAQQQAKKIYGNYTKNAEALKKEVGAPAAGATPAAAPAKGPAKIVLKSKSSSVTIPEIADAEKRIRSAPVDVNRIVSISREVIPDGRLVNYGKAENKVNSLVAWEDGKGNRLPVEGFFEVWL
jgi:hypothetical protein